MAQDSATSLRTWSAKAHGLGASHTGTEHWWTQRLTSVALVPLSLWFVWSMLHLAGASHTVVKAWLHHPTNAALTTLFILVGFHHAAAGMEVIFEDYVHCKPLKLALIYGTKAACAVLGAITLFSILKLALGG